MSDRRTKRRNLCSDIVELFWSDRLRWPHRVKAVLEDISPTGACLQMEAAIPVSTEVAVRMGELGLPGRVRYCTLIGGGYFVGVEFEAGTQWESEEYHPEHFLDPEMFEESYTLEVK
jgi:PilZ domain